MTASGIFEKFLASAESIRIRKAMKLAMGAGRGGV